MEDKKDLQVLNKPDPKSVELTYLQRTIMDIHDLCRDRDVPPREGEHPVVGDVRAAIRGTKPWQEPDVPDFRRVRDLKEGDTFETTEDGERVKWEVLSCGPLPDVLWTNYYRVTVRELGAERSMILDLPSGAIIGEEYP